MKIEDIEVIGANKSATGCTIMLPDVTIDGEEWKYINNPKFGADIDKFMISNMGRIKQMKKYGKKLSKPIYLPCYVASNKYYYYILTYENPNGGKGIRNKRFAPKLISEYFMENPKNRKYVEFRDPLKPWPLYVANLKWKISGWTTSQTDSVSRSTAHVLCELLDKGIAANDIATACRKEIPSITAHVSDKDLKIMAYKLANTAWFWWIRSNSAVEEMSRNETWQPLVYPSVREGSYLISNYGRIKSIQSRYRLGKILVPHDSAININYPVHYSLRREDGTYSTFSAAALMAAHFHSHWIDSVHSRSILRDPNAKFPYHINNIRVVPNSKYYQDEWLHKISVGEDHSAAVMAIDEVRKICELFEKGYSVMDCTELMRSYWPNNTEDGRRVYSNRIRHVYNRKTWKSISKDYEW